MSDGRNRREAVWSPLSRWRPRSLLARFLLFLTPVFFVLAVPGIGYLVHVELRADQDILAARFGNQAARAAIALSRHGALANPQLARDILSPLAADRAFVCAEIIGGDGTRLIALPPAQGCSARHDAMELVLPLPGDAATTMRVLFSDAELQATGRQQILLAVSVIALAYLFAVVSATIGFRTIVSGPLRSLLAAIRQSMETGERTPVGIQGGYELGSVIQAFDEMLLRENDREAALTCANARLRDSETALRKLNEELEGRVRERTADLDAARLRAEAANQTKSEFLAAMSHELRTPLNAIIGFSEVMKQQTHGPVGSAKYGDYINDINDSGKHLLAVINDILDLSKVEAGLEELTEECVEVSSVIDSVLTLVCQRVQNGGLNLELDIPDEIPLLFADGRKLKQILVNLLSNAIKFTDRGGKVTFTASCDSDDGFLFEVADTGIGIAADDIPKALSQFVQVDGDLNRQYEGTGLGLPLTKALVDLHGGSMDLLSEVGVGTTVRIGLPATRICGCNSFSAMCSTAE